MSLTSLYSETVERFFSETVTPRHKVTPSTQGDDRHASLLYQQLLDEAITGGSESYLSILKSSWRGASLSEKLSDRIYKHFIEADKVRNIKSLYVATKTDEGDMRYSYVRDARHALKDSRELKQEEEKSRYKTMVTNYVMTLGLLLKGHEDEEPNHAEMIKLCEDFDKTVGNAPDAEQYFLGYVKFVIAPILIKKGIVPPNSDAGVPLRDEEKTVRALKILDECKNWSALELDSCDVMTVDRVSNDEGKTTDIVRMETPVVLLTQQQRHEYSEKYKTQEWFLNLSDHQQKLYETHFKDLILKGRVLPSQLRNALPGLKNAYHSQVFASQEAGGLMKHADFFHCGALPYLGGTEYAMKDSAILAAKQQQEVFDFYTDKSGQQHSFVMATLNSRTVDSILSWGSRIRNGLKFLYNLVAGVLGVKKFRYEKYEAFDSSILAGTRVAEAASDILTMNHVNLSLNVSRRWESAYGKGAWHVHKAAKKSLKSIRNKIEEKTEQFQHEYGIERIEIERQLEDLKKIEKALNSSTKALRKKLLWAPSRMVRNPKDKDVKNVEINQLMTQISLQLSQARECDQDLSKEVDSIITCFGCASGDNRTMIAAFVAALNPMVATLKDKGYSQPEITQKLAHSQHLQLMTGFQGGTQGTCGIRRKSIDALPDRLLKIDSSLKTTLTSRTADCKAVGAMLRSGLKKMLKRKKKQKTVERRSLVLNEEQVKDITSGVMLTATGERPAEEKRSTGYKEMILDSLYLDQLNNLTPRQKVILVSVLGVGSLAFFKVFAGYRLAAMSVGAISTGVTLFSGRQVDAGGQQPSLDDLSADSADATSVPARVGG